LKQLLLVISLIFVSPLFAQPADIDFSKAYIVPEQSSVDKVTIGGIKPLWSDLFYSVDFTLAPDYTMSVLGVLNQSSIQEQLEQRLRNTTWKGSYAVNNDNLITTLKLVVVQDGYVGGEIIHTEPESEGGGYLHTRVTGDIITQYQIGDAFIDEDRIASEVLAGLSPTTETRQLVRIKRVRAIEFINDSDGSVWNTNREYRMTLEDNILTGVVGLPNRNYGSDDGTSGNGSITLILSNE